jgi:hypothetical protein
MQDSGARGPLLFRVGLLDLLDTTGRGPGQQASESVWSVTKRASCVTERSASTMAAQLRVLTRVKNECGRFSSEIFDMPVVYNRKFARRYG